ncbi:MAG: metallophosphoesterase [Nanoarchaeota archaeon]
MKIEYIGKCLLINDKDEKVLVVGDLHLGYEEAMNRSGVFVTREMYNEMIKEFDEIFLNVGRVEKIILLGDVKHAFSGNLSQEWNDVLRLIEYLKGKCMELIILKGNHDNYLVNIARKGEIEVEKNYFWNGFMFLHGDVDSVELYDKKIEYWVMGHAHPAIKISDGSKIEKYKCFLAGKYKDKKVIILPSFFPLVIGSDVREDLNVPWEFDVENFEIKVVGDNLEVFDFGKVKKIR